MACQPQDNPRSASSDGVPPELAVLGFRKASLRPTGLTGRRRVSFGSDRCNPARSSTCVLANSASTLCRYYLYIESRMHSKDPYMDITLFQNISISRLSNFILMKYFK